VFLEKKPSAKQWKALKTLKVRTEERKGPSLHYPMARSLPFSRTLLLLSALLLLSSVAEAAITITEIFGNSNRLLYTDENGKQSFGHGLDWTVCPPPPHRLSSTLPRLSYI